MRYCRRCRRPLGERYTTIGGERVCLACGQGLVEVGEVRMSRQEIKRMSWERRAEKEARLAAARKANP